MKKQVLLTLDVSKWPDDAVNLIENRVCNMPWVEWIEGVEQAEREAHHSFIAWAGEAGYDTAHAYDTQRSCWVFWNPMTADLWDAWTAASKRFDPLAKLTELQESLGLYKEEK